MASRICDVIERIWETVQTENSKQGQKKNDLVLNKIVFGISNKKIN